jgi:hypothetical protein
MVALFVLVRRADIMGAFAIRGLTLALALLATCVVLALNLLLLAITAGVKIPGLTDG